jgi:hypothetical protein
MQGRRPVVVLFRVHQISERTMARKRRFRFGLRDVVAGRLCIAQGRRGNWSVQLAETADIYAAANENDLRMKQHNPGYIRLKKPAASSLSAGFSILAMMMLCR